MLRLCRVDCKCCFHPRSLPTANLQLEPSSHRGGKWYRRLISSTAWPSAQLNSGFEPRKNSCYARFTWCEHSKKTSAGGDREQLMLLLFICSKSGKSKLTRRMVILRFEIQNLKEQFTPNSHLHVFPQPCISGLCWRGFPTFSFVFLDHEVHSSSWSTWKYTWKPLCWSHAPVSYEVHKLCCEQFHVGTIFFLPNYNHLTVCSGKRARTHVGTWFLLQDVNTDESSWAEL